MTAILTNGRLLTPGGIVAGQALVVDGDRITDIVPAASAPSGDSVDLGGGLLVPGFIDTQVNGGGGLLFNDAPTVETVAAIGAAHRQFGTTGFLPTLISDDLSVIRAGIEAVDAAIKAGVPGVLGIHVEGPFLNEYRKGIHDADKIRRLDAEGVEVLTTPHAGRTLVTVAPECTTPDMIARLVAGGAVVAAGHTNGTYDSIRGAIDAGLSGVTHLFNAMSPLGSREPGVVGAALESLDLWCGIIVDGFHVSPVTLKLALRCRPHNRFMLVTDAMPTVGAPTKEFWLQGKRISAGSGVCVDDSGTLAGSDLDMAAAVRNAIDMLEVEPETAFAMASSVPGDFLGLAGELGTIAPGYRASLVLLDDQLNVSATWIDGAIERH